MYKVVRAREVVQVVGLCRNGGRLKRIEAGVRYRPRWQADVQVGVVGRIDFQVFKRGRVRVAAEDISEDRIDLERHAELKTGREDAGDDAFILDCPRLFLNKRSDDDKIGERVSGHLYLAGQCCYLRIEIRAHCRNDGASIRRGKKQIRVRKEIP